MCLQTLANKYPGLRATAIQQKTAGHTVCSVGILVQCLGLRVHWVPVRAGACQGPLLCGFAFRPEVAQAVQ